MNDLHPVDIASDPNSHAHASSRRALLIIPMDLLGDGSSTD